MDQATVSSSSANDNNNSSNEVSSSTNDPSSRRGNPRKNNRPNPKGQQQDAAGSGTSNNRAGRGSNTTNNRRKDKDKEKAKEKGEPNAAGSGSGPNPRAPRTIAATDPIDLQAGKHETTATTTTASETAAPAVAEDGEQHSCFICTENIVIFAVSDCNHRTCHLCSLRLRALYKTKNCAYCKADQGIMIFTRDAEKPFQDYDLKAMAYYDRKLNVYFEDQEMYEDTMVLLRFNCPDPVCEVACPEGWNQLKSHVKKVHKLMLCDLCVRHKKVFAHEHNLMTASQLMKHFKNGDSGQANQNSAEPSGFKGHPSCGFCKDSFYGDDELFEHCKKNHEQCFLCLRRNIRHQYYNKYADLERHLHAEHYACMDPECLEKKFVVFDSDLDLKAHEAEMHPHMTHGQRNRMRDARKIDISFNYQPTGESSNTRRGGGGGGGGRGNRQSRQNQGAEAVPAQPQLTPHQIQQIALQQQMAQEQERRNNSEAADSAQEALSDLSLNNASSSPSTGIKTMMRSQPPAGFGSSLSEPAPVRPQSPAISTAARVAANIQRTSSPLMRSSSPVVVSQSTSEWPAVSAAGSGSTNAVASRPQQASGSKPGAPVASETLNKHTVLQERVKQYLQGTSGTLSQFRTLTTQFRNSQIPANQYVASLFSLFGSDMDKTGKIVQGLYDVLDTETKKAEVMRAWRDYKTVQNQFPSLESTVTSNPTMADIVTPSTRRVLVIKSSGTTRGGLGHTKPKSTSTWDRAAAAASSLSRTGSPSAGTRSTPVFYPTPQLNSSAAWSLPEDPLPSASSSNSSSNSKVNNSSSSSSSQNRGQSNASTSWAAIPNSSNKSSSTAPQFRPSTTPYGSGRPVTTAAAASEHFPSLVSQAPAGNKPSFGLLPMQKSKSQQEDAPNGWMTGWNALSAEQDSAEDEGLTGKKKKNKKKILFHVG
ncbi:hypothetical protein BGZ51_003878 [Haplosporangium sp. Z 767]|nr:hypothetical protein BGZ51_003878 [Haplosporangium sp. Z 767]KAF9195812.1 hypothetical protein BGZ50_003303 [Haplosporangium sp. Z 11]